MGRPSVQLAVLGFLLIGVSSSPVNKHDVDIYSFHVNATVTSRYAITLITSRVANRLNGSQEIHFQVKIPKDAFISSFKMTIEGKTYDGVVKEKEEAKQQYAEAVSRRESAGMVSSVGRTLEEFKTSVTVAAFSKVTFELTYEELLRRRLGKYQLLINAQPMQPVADFKIDIYMNERQGFSFLEVKGGLKTKDLSSAITSTQAASNQEARVTFRPTREQQAACCGDEGLKGDLLIVYDVERHAASGELQASGGFFVHHFAPAELRRIPKNAVFVIDRSGSMSGTKMEQTRSALLTILGDLGEEDFFGLITFDSRVEVWKHELLPATESKLKEARGFVQGIEPRGATDINAAVLKGVDMIRQFPREGTASILILLTDGDPTSGEINTNKIQRNIQEAIGEKFPLYCLGFGYDVNFDFLDKLALENSGLARRIYEDSDADLQLQGFYEEVATPLLSAVRLKYSGAADLTKSGFDLYYNGSEIVVAGRIADNDTEILHVEVDALSRGENVTYRDSVSTREVMDVQREDFAQRLWAYLTVKQLLEKEVTLKGEEKEAARKKALDLSLKYRFVTPLTSMVVTKPQEGETQVAHKPKEGPPVNQPLSRTSNRRFKTAMVAAGSHPVLHSYRQIPAPAGPAYRKRVSSNSRQDSFPSRIQPKVFTGQALPAASQVTNIFPSYASKVMETRFLIPAQPRSICYDVPVGREVSIVSCPSSNTSLSGQVAEKGFGAITVHHQGSSHTFSFRNDKIAIGHVEGHNSQHVTVDPNGDRALVDVGHLKVSLNSIHHDGGVFMWPEVQAPSQGAACILEKGNFQYEELPGSGIKIGDEEVLASLSSATDYSAASTPAVDCWLVPLRFVLQKDLAVLGFPAKLD